MSLTWPQVERERIRRGGYAEFIQRAWHTVEPTPLVWGPVCEQQCVHIQAQLRGEIRELLINVPPGTSKSTISTVMLAPWVWTIDPTIQFMYASYDLNLTTRLAEKSIRVMRSQWYQDRWGDLIDGGAENAAVTSFRTIAGGTRIATSIGGGAAGKHCNWFVVDDPIKPPTNDPKTQVKRATLDMARNWMQVTLATRGGVDPSTYRRTMVMQRVHELDPSEVAIREGWTHLCLPMLFEPERKSVTAWGGDWRTVRDETLDPVRRPKEVLEATVHGMGGWGSPVEVGQWQQRPSPPGGLIFKRETFKRFKLRDMPLHNTFSVISVDCAFKATQSTDNVAIEVWGSNGSNFYCYDSVCERMSFVETVDAVRAMMRKWPGVHAVLIEDKANGPAVTDTLRANGVSNIIEINPVGGKTARGHAANVYYRAGGVHHLEGADWLERKELNLAGFPTMANDDDVDTTTQAICWLAPQTGADFLAIPDGAWADLINPIANVFPRLSA